MSTSKNNIELDALISSEHTTSLLVVDDDPINLEVYQRCLEELPQVEVDCASSGQEALSKAEKKQFELALMDVRMPGMDGYQTAQNLQDRFGAKAPGVIFITAQAPEDSNVLKGLKLGGIDFLFKPYNLDVLQAKVDKALKSRLYTQALKEANERLRIEVENRLLAENDLNEAKQLLQSILDGMGAAVFYVDPSEYKITMANTVGLEMLGLSTEEVLGRQCCDLICPGKHHVPGKNCRMYMKKIINKEAELTLPDGKIISIIKHVLPADIKGHKHHIEIIFDISERKSLEKQLLYAHKLESIGQLAAGIAHEINTPTQFIRNNIEYLKGSVQTLETFVSKLRGIVSEEPEKKSLDASFDSVKRELDHFESEIYLTDATDALAESLEGIDRIASIVHSIRRLAHPGGEDKTQMDVNDSIRNTVTVSTSEWKYVAKMELDLDDDLPRVPGYPSEFNQVILNMIVNAAHAIQEKNNGTETEKGKITISTKRDHDKISIEISDTGNGISKDIYHKIFDPFFTTKEVGKGTGQGLAISYNIICDKHDGTISFESNEGQGTTFFLNLPIS